MLKVQTMSMREFSSKINSLVGQKLYVGSVGDGQKCFQ